MLIKLNAKEFEDTYLVKITHLDCFVIIMTNTLHEL